MSFFRYPGGKKKLKEQIVPKLIRLSKGCSQYVEPFMGGGSITVEILKKFSIFKYWLNDIDVGISSLWNSIIFNPAELKKLVISFIPSTEKFYEYKEYFLNDPLPSVDTGFKKIALHQISYSGLGVKSGGPLGGRNQLSKYTIGCRWSPYYICKQIDYFHNLLYPLHKNIIISNLDFEQLFINNPLKSVYYLDPPYYVKGSELYQHSFLIEDHERLANLLKKTEHNWLLSYDDCPEIRELYSWAKINSIDVTYSINTVNIKREVLIERN